MRAAESFVFSSELPCRVSAEGLAVRFRVDYDCHQVTFACVIGDVGGQWQRVVFQDHLDVVIAELERGVGLTIALPGCRLKLDPTSTAALAEAAQRLRHDIETSSRRVH
ncbi:hypothetical protein J2T57_001343 [Natronocella acetinitrilica]|uniref:Uncharacterized protein n=1 Tax=Natronocella acetinitrilica TaxID=414046 RepID=A0AAE3KB51_9GAMM|nr:hypothetical protein [Natronocella acetinitrilica]MCP1674241.1 hypothetical protein [Natronocella acetinitrilica]